nr:translation initiation factor IF-2-like [Peromyscus maniculatus bairdii]
MDTELQTKTVNSRSGTCKRVNRSPGLEERPAERVSAHKLWSRAAPQPLAPPASAPAGSASPSGEGLRSAARCCPPIPPPGAALAAAPPAGTARWYSQAPGVGEQGLRIAQRPLGVSPRLCKRPWPCPLPAPEVSERPGLSQACAPAGGPQPHLPIFGTSPARWTLEGIPVCPPEMVAKPRRLASSLPPSSIHLSGSRVQSPASLWDQALVQQQHKCSKDIGLDVNQGEARGPSRGPGSSLSMQEGCHCPLRDHSGDPHVTQGTQTFPYWQLSHHRTKGRRGPREFKLLDQG